MGGGSSKVCFIRRTFGLWLQAPLQTLSDSTPRPEAARGGAGAEAREPARAAAGRAVRLRSAGEGS